MKRCAHMRRIRHSSARHGAAALLVLVCLSFATVVATLLIKSGLAERTYVSRLEFANQADWLVEAGIDRAAAQLTRSASYKGETWPISFTRLDSPRTVLVRIKVKQDTDPKFRLIRVTAQLSGTGTPTLEIHKEVRVLVKTVGDAG
jgi:type II secretory pathway component PulK